MQTITPSSAYTKTRALYERTYPDANLGVYTEEDWARLQSAEQLALGDSVLDIGPGNGALLQILNQSKKHKLIHGVDIHRHSQLLLPDSVKYHLQSVTELEFEDNSFNTVFCMEVLEHLEDSDLAPAIAQLRRIAKTRLVMTVPYHEPHPLWWHDKPGGHRQQFDANRILFMFPNARAFFQKRHGVDWIFLIEGANSEANFINLRTLLAKDLKTKPILEKSPKKSVPSRPGKASTSSVDKNHDRILDVYYGRHGNDQMQEHARDRIHWILSKATGNRVLDIGCSQGLVPILLGRSGYKVVGIDLLPESIEQARAALKEDPQSVQDLVEFRVADASHLEGLKDFETVILGEIIEHHAKPARLLESIYGALQPGGTLVLTTPFAFHPDPDHKQIFFLSNLSDLLVEHFENINFSIMHNFICCTANARKGKATTKQLLSDRELLLRSEKAFLDLQLNLRKQLKDVRFMYHQEKSAAKKAEAIQQMNQRLANSNEILNTQSLSQRAQIHSLSRTVKAHKAALQYRKKEKRPLFAGLIESIASATTAAEKRKTKEPLATNEISETAKWVRHVEHGKLSLPVACILDEFSWENFRFECDLYKLSKEAWKDELKAKRPEFLFVESAWAGNDGDWKYKITYKEAREDNPLFALLAYCKEEGIPTVFWNKEDPPNYNHFIDAACRFDYIFTTDEDCVESYRQAAPDAQVSVLPFAAQPCMQNPVNTSHMPKLGDICFAGAWYPRHPERFEDLENLLTASTDYDLHIYDRYLHHPQHENYLFPEPYQPFIKGSLDFKEMTEKYRNYRIFLNVNSVKDSPSMFSRRVFEIIACGTPVVSGYAKGIETMLGNDIVPLVRNTEEAKECIDRLMNSELERDKLVLRGQRKIFSEHTYRHRFSTICSALGLHTQKREHRVSVITATIRKNFVDHFLNNYARQSFPNKELIVVINKNRELTKDYINERALALSIQNFKVVVVPEATTLGTCLNIGVSEAKGSLFAKMDDDDYYGTDYLLDSVLALEYSGADCVGKESYFTYVESQNKTYRQSKGREHREAKFAIGTTLVGYTSLFPQVSFGNTRVGEDTVFLKRLIAAGKKLYSHSPYNYIKLYAKNSNHHTWKIDEASYLKRATFTCNGGGQNDVCF